MKIANLCGEGTEKNRRWKTIIEFESKCFCLSYFASINSSIFMVVHLCEKQSREGSYRKDGAAGKTLSRQIEMNVKRDFENRRISVQAEEIERWENRLSGGCCRMVFGEKFVDLRISTKKLGK